MKSPIDIVRGRIVDIDKHGIAARKKPATMVTPVAVFE